MPCIGKKITIVDKFKLDWDQDHVHGMSLRLKILFFVENKRF